MRVRVNEDRTQIHLGVKLNNMIGVMHQNMYTTPDTKCTRTFIQHLILNAPEHLYNTWYWMHKNSYTTPDTKCTRTFIQHL